MKPVIHIIAGPTAVGKTELALQWAEQHDAEILSCDAYCLYQGMNIGTAKPSADELARVVHHGIDIVPCSQSFSVAEYVDYASEIVEDVFSRGKNLLVAGGSGFYLKSFLAPVADSIQVSANIRLEVTTLYEEKGLEACVDALSHRNPLGLGDMDLKNPRRVLNALERCMASGLTVMQMKAAFEKQGTPYDLYDKKVCCLLRDRELLKERIYQRAAQMIDLGLIDEVQSLLELGLRENQSAAAAIGYREVIHWLDQGTGDTSILLDEIARNTVKLVKKQMTWLRTQIHDKKEYYLDAENLGNPDELFS